MHQILETAPIFFFSLIKTTHISAELVVRCLVACYFGCQISFCFNDSFCCTPNLKEWMHTHTRISMLCKRKTNEKRSSNFCTKSKCVNLTVDGTKLNKAVTICNYLLSVLQTERSLFVVVLFVQFDTRNRVEEEKNCSQR